ncbi:MAG TPA: BON domain-containing protein [Pyrinomonadaceae bacterium]|jgi:osmotically-inducible protein OsmY
MASRNYDHDQDRYRRPEYDRYGESDYGRSSGRRQNRFEDEDRYSSRLRRNERERDFSGTAESDFDRDYGRGYSQPYGTEGRGYGSNYADRYREREGENYFDRANFYRGSQTRPSSTQRNRQPLNNRSGFNAEWNRGDYRQGLDERSYEYDVRGHQSERSHERGWWDKVSDELASWFGDEEAERRRRMDEAQSGSTFRGKGPKGYRRSDERIREDVNDRLTEYDYLDASDIEVAVSESVVTLNGSVDSRWAKHIAEDIAETVSGVTDVENNLRVNRASQRSHIGTSHTDLRSEENKAVGASKAQAKGA